jgi:hypothetical protein
LSGEIAHELYCRSVLSRIKAIVQDEDEILDEWDHQVFASLKIFLKSEDVSKVLGAQSCLLTIERAVRLRLLTSFVLHL